MPIHDWTRSQAGDFHHFHQRWISALTDVLNGGVLPDEFMALAEQVTGRPIPDVVTLKSRSSQWKSAKGSAGVAVASIPPLSARLVRKSSKLTTPGAPTAL